MKLIDADKTIIELSYKIARLAAREQAYMKNGLIDMADIMARKIELCIECRELLEHQPTTYDVDKVVKQLEELETHCLEMRDWQGQSAIERAIDIVKGGGRD